MGISEICSNSMLIVSPHPRPNRDTMLHSQVKFTGEASANEVEGVAHHPLAVPSSLANGNIAEEEQVIHIAGDIYL